MWYLDEYLKNSDLTARLYYIANSNDGDLDQLLLTGYLTNKIGFNVRHSWANKTDAVYKILDAANGFFSGVSQLKENLIRRSEAILHEMDNDYSMSKSLMAGNRIMSSNLTLYKEFTGTEIGISDISLEVYLVTDTKVKDYSILDRIRFMFGNGDLKDSDATYEGILDDIKKMLKRLRDYGMELMKKPLRSDPTQASKDNKDGKSDSGSGNGNNNSGNGNGQPSSGSVGSGGNPPPKSEVQKQNETNKSVAPKEKVPVDEKTGQRLITKISQIETPSDLWYYITHSNIIIGDNKESIHSQNMRFGGGYKSSVLYSITAPPSKFRHSMGYDPNLFVDGSYRLVTNQFVINNLVLSSMNVEFSESESSLNKGIPIYAKVTLNFEFGKNPTQHDIVRLLNARPFKDKDGNDKIDNDHYDQGIAIGL